MLNETVYWMKKAEKINRTRRITLRLMLDEYDNVHKKFEKTTCRKFSEYIRNVLLDKKLTVYTRSRSMDEFMAEMIQLRKELNAIGHNFNQSVKRLHTLDKIGEAKSWVLMHEANQKFIARKVDEIKEKINQFSDKWLQE